MMPIRRHQRKPENYGVSARDGEPQLIFPPVLKSNHTMLVVRGRLASTQRRAAHLFVCGESCDCAECWPGMCTCVHPRILDNDWTIRDGRELSH